MKKLIAALLCLALTAFSAVIFSGCGEEELVASTVAVEETTDSAKMDISDSSVLSELHPINYNGDQFAGAWQITEGEGTKYKSFVFVFDGEKTAYLIIGTTGYIEYYKLENKPDDTGTDVPTIKAEMMFGINGTYTYEFSNDSNTLKLTNIADQTTLTLTKLATFSFIPLPDPEPAIDEALLGAWSDSEGEYYYFDKSGIMYNSINELSFTYSKYSAKDGKVTSTYTTNKEETVENNYSVKDDVLTYGNYTYKRIPVEELK